MPDDPIAVVVVEGQGLAYASVARSGSVAATRSVDALQELIGGGARLVWWSAEQTARPLMRAGLTVAACWDLAAVSRLLYGGSRDDPGAVWSLAHDLPEPAPLGPELDLLDLHDESDTQPVRPDGQLSRLWQAGGWARDLDTAQRWAELAVVVQQRQAAALAALPDPRPAPSRTPLPVLTAYAESAAALLAVELGEVGLPVDRDVLAGILEPVIGPPPVDDAHAAARRRARDEVVRRHFPHADEVDLRNPAQVREMLARFGLVLPDTRSWRLEPHASTSEPVAALLAWRKAERLATTYGWSWIERSVGADGRLRGAWTAAEGAGRMTASAGLHNLPAELRPAVRAEPGHVMIRADLGQVEPRVLAVVSGDRALAQAARDADMYAPVAARLGCDRPTAKVAVLAAMYGQTSGTAGNALRQMDRTYPQAMGYLRAAEEAGREGRALRTYGGRLLRMQPGWGRFARNAVVQGAAAELFKAWAATVRAGLRPEASIVLCLHDELLVHAPTNQAEDVAGLLADALTSTARWWASGSEVRFVADVSIADSWADAH